MPNPIQISSPLYHEIDVEAYLGLFTLIVGDINSGKTTLTRRIVEALAAHDPKSRITVVDLAPKIRSSAENESGIGGALSVSGGGLISTYRPKIVPPRMTAKDDAEAVMLAEKNVAVIEALFQDIENDGADSLVINDCSLYLHAGNPETFLGWVRGYGTAVVNGYDGDYFKEGAISKRERSAMAFLSERCDRLLRLTR